MSNIFGTILSVGDFLDIKTTVVSILRGYEKVSAYSLAENRKYIIPDYQREIRWSKENLIELISDISNGAKFLGNIILNERTPKEYEVIDGQQRITILLMIIYCIKSRFKNTIDILDTCELEMSNFDKFHLLIENNFRIDGLTPDVNSQLENSDVFNQRKAYNALWVQIENSDLLRTAKQCRFFLTNLIRSEINLIVNKDSTYSIEYFLDVNLKGVKLDTEDIFKGYLFSRDANQPIRDEWKIFKINAFKLNELTEYSTVKLLEHYFYCSLYKNNKYRNLQFKEDFTIYETEIEGIKHYAGEHIIAVIEDNDYMIRSLKNINKFLNIILDIIKSESPEHNFKRMFNPSAHVDSVETVVIHNFIKKIMLDKNVVPKMLVMKYIIEVFFNSGEATKDDYRKIYGIYLLAILFTVFEGDKDIKKVLGVVKDNNWYDKVVEQSKSYFSCGKISKSRLTAQYKLINTNETENYMFRCKSLATIYNFFEISTNTVRIISGKMDKLKAYISDSDRFSHEHFIINYCKAFSFISDNTRKYKYPPDIRKYANSIFNFIFISKQLNQELGNNILSEKINILDEKLEPLSQIIECEFSKMIIERCRIDFANPVIPLTENIDECAQVMDLYYRSHFNEEFSLYALEVIKKIGEKLGVV